MRELWNRLLGRRRSDGDALACRELVELVSDYLEGALSLPERARFETHIAGCGNCTAYLHQMREVIALMGELTTESLSPRAEAELVVAFRGWKAVP